jgi:hypothetical protein
VCLGLAAFTLTEALRANHAKAEFFIRLNEDQKYFSKLTSAVT